MVEAIRAKRLLGQHFLVDRHYCRRIVDFLEPVETDLVVEIGPGTGELTHHLVAAVERVFAVELDRDLIGALQKRFADEIAGGRLQVQHSDVLRWQWLEQLPAGVPKWIGNLPYNIATRILTKTTDIAARFQSLTAMVQKEVAERVLAGPGEAGYGYLSVLMQLHYHRRAGFDVPPGAFRPVPKVVSHVLQLRPRADVPAGKPRQRVLSAVSLAFRHPRKTLLNNLKPHFDPVAVSEALSRTGLGSRVRPAEVTPAQYQALAELLTRPGS